MKSFLAGNKSFRLSNVDMITGASVMLLGMFLLFYAIPEHTAMGFASTSGISPRTLPYGVAVLLIVCGLKVLYDGYHQKRIHDRAAAAKGVSSETMVSFYTLSFVIAGMGFIGAALLDLVGYPIINTALIMGMYYFSGGKKLWVAVALGVIFTICSVLFFSSYLQLSIPFGEWL